MDFIHLIALVAKVVLVRWFLTVLLTLYSVALLSSIAALEALSVVLTLIAMGLFAVERLKGQKPPKLPFGWVEWSLISFNLVLFVSIALSPVRPIDWQNGLKFFKISLWYWALSFLLVRYFKLKDLKCWVPFWVVLVTIVAVYTIVQFFTGIDLVRNPGRVTQYMGYYRPVGFFSMALTLAYSLGIATMSILPFAFLRGQKVPRGYFAAACGVCVLALTLTLSRGVWAGALVALTVVLAVVGSRRQIIGLSLLLVGAVLALSLNPAVQSKVNDLFDLSNHSNSYRLVLWEAYFTMFKDHWIIGTGWHQSEPLLKEYLTKIGEPRFRFFSHAHNNYLQIMAGAGLAGLLSFLAFCAAGIWRSLRMIMQEKSLSFYKVMGTSFLASQMIFHVGGLSECNLLDAEVTHIFISHMALMRVLLSKDFTE